MQHAPSRRFCARQRPWTRRHRSRQPGVCRRRPPACPPVARRLAVGRRHGAAENRHRLFGDNALDPARRRVGGARWPFPVREGRGGWGRGGGGERERGGGFGGCGRGDERGGRKEGGGEGRGEGGGGGKGGERGRGGGWERGGRERGEGRGGGRRRGGGGRAGGERGGAGPRLPGKAQKLTDSDYPCGGTSALSAHDHFDARGLASRSVSIEHHAAGTGAAIKPAPVPAVILDPNRT